MSRLILDCGELVKTFRILSNKSELRDLDGKKDMHGVCSEDGQCVNVLVRDVLS